MKNAKLTELGSAMVEMALIVALVGLIAAAGAKTIGEKTCKKFGNINLVLGGDRGDNCQVVGDDDIPP